MKCAVILLQKGLWDKFTEPNFTELCQYKNYGWSFIVHTHKT